MRLTLSLIALAAALPAFADEVRQLDAHEHGVGALDIAMDGQTVAMELRAPGADIVGFEYAPTSAADRDAVAAAVATLARPFDLFHLPESAACSVVSASATLLQDDAHDDHDHDDDHTHDKDQDHEKDHVHDHEPRGEKGAGHSEFHASYTLSCENPDELTAITFPYFDAFSNARELEVQVLTATGARAFEVVREDPALDLRGSF